MALRHLFYMNYGPSGLAPSQTPYSEAESRVGNSRTVWIGIFSFLLGLGFGAMYISDKQYAIGGSILVIGVAFGILMFYLAERAEQRSTLEPHGWMLDRTYVKYGVLLVGLGAYAFLIERMVGDGSVTFIMVGASGIALIAIGLVWIVACIRY